MKRLTGGLLGVGMLAVAGVSAVKVAGSRIRGHHDADLDGLAASPGTLHHHRLPTADGGELHVVDSGGDGPPVVLLHGVTLQWWVWSALISLLRGRHRVLAWDMRGHGESRAGSDGVSLEAVAGDLAMLLRELDLEDPILVGHSMGGMALGQFVRDFPQMAARVAGLYFVATSARALDRSPRLGSLRTAYGLAGYALLNGLKRPSPRYPWPDNDLSAVLIRAAFGPKATADMVDAVRRMSADMATASMIEAGNAIARHDVRDALRSVEVPTAVIVGDVDRLTPPGHARIIAELVPGATLTVLDGVGHQVMQEHPRALAAGIAELLAR